MSARGGGAGLRRGAVMPLMLVMIVALVGAAALAIDVARMTWTAAELQAAADASALAAARAIQTSTAASQTATAAKNGAASLAALNRAGNAPAVALPADVLPLRYDTAASPRTSSTTWESTTLNAVQVTTRATATRTLGGIFDGAAPVLSRKSTAWVASVVGASCVRPISLPYSDFYNIVFFDTWNTTNWGSANLTQPMLAGLRDVGASWRSLVLPGYPKVPSNSRMKFDTWWRPLDYNGANSMTDFGDWMLGQDCADAVAKVGTYVRPLDRSVDTWIPATNTAMGTACNLRGGGDAHCYVSSGSSAIGVRMRAALTDDDYSRPYGSQGSPWQLTRGVTVVRMMCYFRSSSDVCSAVSNFDASGTWYPPYSQTTGYPAGTMIVLLDGPAGVDITRDMTLGTTVGFAQRILVAQ